MFKMAARCRLCGNPELVTLLDLGEQNLTGVFPASRSAAPTRGPLELVKCWGRSACGLVQLRHTYESSEMYGENYGYRSSLNRSMVDHLRGIVAYVRRLNPLSPGDIVLDIGSNDGTLLSCYPNDGPSLFGMDPTGNKFRKYYREDVHLIPDFFSAERFLQNTKAKKASIVTSIAMFYDLQNPLEFMRQIAQVLADDGIWHFEQSYLPSMLRSDAYDTICHEHVEYYSLSDLVWAAERADLKIIDVALNSTNGGSFAVTAATSRSRRQPNAQTIESLLQAEKDFGINTLAPFKAFAERVALHRTQFRSLLTQLKAQGRTVLGYGASTKGNVILQYCGLTENDLPAIADVNADKLGHFTPGTNIPIISEEEAHRRKPDYFVVLPWHFRDGILQREREFLARGGKMIFPLPAIEIVAS
jgi:C-methyltransferase-like protein/methyltransferase family protein/putative zinc binding protein